MLKCVCVAACCLDLLCAERFENTFDSLSGIYIIIYPKPYDLCRINL